MIRLTFLSLGVLFAAKFLTRAENGMKNASVESERNGFCMAIETVSALLDDEWLVRIAGTLISCIRDSKGSEHWADSRRLAVQALASVAANRIVIIRKEMIENIGDAMLSVMEYHPTDARGDIGSV